MVRKLSEKASSNVIPVDNPRKGDAVTLDDVFSVSPHARAHHGLNGEKASPASPSVTRHYDAAALVAATGDSLRLTARRIGVDPAMLCRPLSLAQADRYALALDLHPSEVWPHWWDDAMATCSAHPRSPTWRRIAAARVAAADGTARTIRLAALLTVDDVARALGVKRSRVTQWEQGINRPTGPVGERYASMLVEMAIAAADHHRRLVNAAVQP